ncbi:exo-beta-N-acetylmuramidase NamZ family protein [Formosa sp. 4Alg 33]|uniref:exo-beta-N-acetylmuramidase NamZ family protein n=1 Tax=Formosa sp. 4Alg 33 TaxID=3382189 RepID=UPI003D9C1E71
MRLNVLKNTVLLFVFIMISFGCLAKPSAENTKQELSVSLSDSTIVVGANRTQAYIPLLKGKSIGIVANQTSVIFKTDSTYTHVVDSLIQLDVNITKVFSPEHGFRGTADAGEVVKDGIDTKTKLPIVSLYGANKKPTADQLKNIDLLIFDIQDVGARFYTYISTLHYVMEACAENNIPMLILDRPNPNGRYIDGPILEMEHKSFVGMHPVPIVHGMTIGEYAQMINGQKWLENGVTCELTVIEMEHYTHDKLYHLPIKPSPNLPNDQSINLYPSLCFFEGTNVNAGRGTQTQFQVYGSPFLKNQEYTYTPKSNKGAKHPKHKDKVCYGVDLTNEKQLNQINLAYIIKAYHATSNKSEFFNSFFTKLAGSKKLQKQIEGNLTVTEIKQSWKTGLDGYKKMSKKYMLYN